MNFVRVFAGAALCAFIFLASCQDAGTNPSPFVPTSDGGSLTVLSPNGGTSKTYYAGEIIPCEILVDSLLSLYLRLEISADNARSWKEFSDVIEIDTDFETPGDTTGDWYRLQTDAAPPAQALMVKFPIPESLYVSDAEGMQPVNGSYLIRIRDYDLHAYCDKSDGLVSIVNR